MSEPQKVKKPIPGPVAKLARFMAEYSADLRVLDHGRGSCIAFLDPITHGNAEPSPSTQILWSAAFGGENLLRVADGLTPADALNKLIAKIPSEPEIARRRAAAKEVK